MVRLTRAPPLRQVDNIERNFTIIVHNSSLAFNDRSEIILRNISHSHIHGDMETGVDVGRTITTMDAHTIDLQKIIQSIEKNRTNERKMILPYNNFELFWEREHRLRSNLSRNSQCLGKANQLAKMPCKTYSGPHTHTIAIE